MLRDVFHVGNCCKTQIRFLDKIFWALFVSALFMMAAQTVHNFFLQHLSTGLCKSLDAT